MSKLNISLDTLLSSPWAIRQDRLSRITANIVKRIESGGELVVENKEDISYEKVNGKAIIDVKGVFYNKCMIDEYWGYVVLDLEQTLISAVDDTSVDEVILKINSPGGSSYGVAEVASLIEELKTTKPINVYVNGMACSALYWIASAASNIYAYEQSDVGSIGVYCMVVDYSKMFNNMGIKMDYIKAGKFKTAGSPYEELSAENRQHLQEGVDKCYADFTKLVAENRGLKLEEVDTWANGIVFEAKDALSIGLIDEIKSWQRVLGYSKNTFSLKQWGNRIMAIGEPKVAELTATDLQAKNPELYESIYNTGFKAGETLGKESSDKEMNTLKDELKTYKEKEAKEENSKKIREFATSLKLTELGETLIAENKSVVEAFSALATEASKVNVDEQIAFEASAPVAAGGSSDNIADELPKTDLEAMEYCKKKYNLTSKREAWRKARLEFASLFGQTESVSTSEKEGN